MGDFLHKIKAVIESESLPFSEAKQEVPIGRGSADIVVYDKSNSPALIFELKQPDGAPVHDPYRPEVVEQACAYASELGVSYFVTSNLRHFVLWKTFQEGTPLLERQLLHYDASTPMEITIRQILSDLQLVKAGKISFLSADAKFVRRLKTFHEVLWPTMVDGIEEKVKADKRFKQEYVEWLFEQDFLYNRETNEKIVKQYAHLLSNRILFYKLLEGNFTQLPKLTGIDSPDGEKFKRALEGYFAKALEIDYEAVFSSTFFDNIPLNQDAMKLFNQFISELERYKLSEIEYDILGKVFESLIPIEERHYLGQYYTRADVVDLIENFCITSHGDAVFDPACGSGTFLVRAYYHLKSKAREKKHRELLSQIYGTDINQFAAHLSVINLTIRDLSQLTNKVNVLVNDFFNLRPTLQVLLPFSGKNIRNKNQHINLPKFDAVVANPPYTRQEELGEYMQAYKRSLEATLIEDWGGKYSLGKRAGIHAYFMLHAPKFLKPNGQLGFIVSNSWMDADYGKEVQKMFLENFKIKAIIESQAERWFEDAAVNTCIIIAEKEDDSEKRRENKVSFTLLKKRLAEYDLKKLAREIEETAEPCEDDEMRVCCVKQGNLLQEGFAQGAQEPGRISQGKRGKPEWLGSKWGKYLRAPQVYFKILAQAEKLKPLAEQAEIRYGIKTGCNEFFYLTPRAAKSFGLERTFLKPLLHTKDFKRVEARDADVKHSVLVVNREKPELRNTNVLKYLQMGEVKEIDKLSTCKSRRRWYDVGARQPAAMLWPKLTYQRHVIPLNKARAFADCNVYEITPNDASHAKAMCAVLNSSLYALFAELAGQKGLGEGANAMMVYDLERMPVIDVSKLGKQTIKELETAFDRLARRDCGTVLEEIKLKDRQALDEIVFGMLGLTQKERKEVYSAAAELVRERTDKAKSVKTNGNGKKKKHETETEFPYEQKTLLPLVF
ncbi:N-6 DNA methylase [Candidatus Micrarchaeota archaeon]|nr:N-6 DNA methylase [Candidatus Micrarchaeota archaeon]